MRHHPSTWPGTRGGGGGPKRSDVHIPRHGVPTQLPDLVDAMLSADPAKRPTIGDVHAALMTLKLAAEEESPPRPATALRGKGPASRGATATGTQPRNPAASSGSWCGNSPTELAMSTVWRCPVCEGVNQGGRTCPACGAMVPHGQPLQPPVKSPLPTAGKPTPPPCRQLRVVRPLPNADPRWLQL